MRAKLGLILFGILLLLVIGFIFRQSLQGGEESRAKSDVIVEAVEPVVEPLLKPELSEWKIHKSISFVVRKAAHLFEFAVLGICACGFFVFLSKCRNRRYRGWQLLLCFAVACCDETIQSFTGRSNSVKDVMLDFVGSVMGILLVLLVVYLVRERKRGEAQCPN